MLPDMLRKTTLALLLAAVPGCVTSSPPPAAAVDVASVDGGAEDPRGQTPRRAQGPRCARADLVLIAEPAPSPGGSEPVELMRGKASGELSFGIGGPGFLLDENACLTFQGKLAAELLDDGRVLSERAQPLGEIRGRTLSTPSGFDSTIGDDGAVESRAFERGSLGTRWRFLEFDPDKSCMGLMMLVALFRALEGVSMAVSDGVAKEPERLAPPPGSRCNGYPR
jgi:hypothetical protein